MKRGGNPGKGLTTRHRRFSFPAFANLMLAGMPAALREFRQGGVIQERMS
jgi:hypothetical protein